LESQGFLSSDRGECGKEEEQQDILLALII
jgi:hypothetical protein